MYPPMGSGSIPMKACLQKVYLTPVQEDELWMLRGTWAGQFWADWDLTMDEWTIASTVAAVRQFVISRFSLSPPSFPSAPRETISKGLLLPGDV